MGRPGGFFKKLKAKEKKAASRNQRGTKGASKEDRRRKHNERVEVFAAKREAEQLAVVSSSSDDEASTDSEAEGRRAARSLRRLRTMLGAAGGATRTPAAQKRTRGGERSAARAVSDDDEEPEEEEGWNSSDSDAAAAKVAMRRPPPRRPRRDTAQSGQKKDGANAAADDDDDDVDGEDWRLFVGPGSSGSGSGDDDDDDEEEEAAELGEETDDADDVVDADLLMDLDEEEESEEEEADDVEEGEEEGEEGVNPLFGLEDEDGGDDDGADLFDDGMLFDDDGAEEDEEDDEDEEKEAAFVDEEDDEDDENDNEADVGARSSHTKKKKSAAADHQLLQTFHFHTSSLSVLQEHGDGALSDKDEWVRKYHLDLHGLVDATPLRPVALPPSALEELAASNAPLQARAAERLATTVDKKQLGLFFVSAEEYATQHPENIAVLASAHAQSHLLHAPFALPRTWEQSPAYLHPALWAKWSAFRSSTQRPLFTVEERGLLDLLQGYPDVMDTLHCWQNSESRREVYALHLLNHWFKARSVVVAHDALLAKRKLAQRARRRQQWARRTQQQQQQQQEELEEEEKAEGGEDVVEKTAAAEQSSPVKGSKKKTKKASLQGKEKVAAPPAANDDDADDNIDVHEEEEEEELELRDRGFSKTRLCVLCPLRNHAYKLVYTLVSILQADPAKCPKLAMFEQDFTEIEEALDPTFRRRPRDYQRAFEGNIDDSFCVGLRLEPERVHVYTHPLNSDLLICSPLGLRRRVEKNGDILVSLSSIEVCLLTEAQMLFQQNWMHVTAVLEMLNKRPTDTTHGLSDLRRVYAWALEGKSGRHRQTILSTEVGNATMLSTFRTTSVNNSGKVVLQRRADPGVLSRVLVPVRQHFIRFDPASLASVDDERFEYFTKRMYETKINAMAERDVRVIVFVPSYFDFVRVRNYLHRDYRESYAAISEYTSLKQQRKALGQFSDLERPVLLVTERFYFFKRYFVKMAEALVFYSPPMFPEYYASLTNRLVATSPNAFAMTLYCRYDTHELNRVVGTSRMVQLLERESGVFSFVTS